MKSLYIFFPPDSSYSVFRKRDEVNVLLQSGVDPDERDHRGTKAVMLVYLLRFKRSYVIFF